VAGNHKAFAAPVLQGAAPARLRVLARGAERLLTVREVAERLGVCTATVYGLCTRGELPHVRVSNAIRIRPRDLDAVLARGLRSGASGGSRFPVLWRELDPVILNPRSVDPRSGVGE
jgi:excisionase family DNA binding protein